MVLGLNLSSCKKCPYYKCVKILQKMIKKFTKKSKPCCERGERASISISVIPKGQLSAFGNDFAPVKIFNAIPLPPFSAALNSAPQHPFLFFFLCSRACPQLVSPGKVVLNTTSPSDGVRFPRRTVGLVGWGGLASMVASIIPKSPNYHGNRESVAISNN